jgi:hypothetical protein
MHIKKDDIPLVAFPHDELWVVFRDQPVDAVLWLSSVTGSADIEVESGETQDPDLLVSFETVNLTFKNDRQLVDLVTAGMPLNHRYMRVRPTAGRVEASVAGPLEFRHFLKSLIT